MFIPTSAQQLDTAVYNHVTNLLLQPFSTILREVFGKEKHNIGLCASVVLNGLCLLGICQCCVFLCHIPP